MNGPSDQFNANYYVDISDMFEDKLDMLRVYKDEIGDIPFLGAHVE